MKDKTNDIIEKASTAFMQHGLHSVSMEDIASWSGISKKTLYSNFESKEMLVETIVHQLISKTSKYLRLCQDISPNAVKEMENFSKYILDVLEVLTPKFTRDLKKYYPGAYAQLIAFRDESVIPYIDRCLKRGITEEIFRPGINKQNTGWLYCWQIQNVLEGYTSQEDVNRIIKNTNDLFLHGILNQKGLKLLSLNKHHEITLEKMKPSSG